MQKIPENVNTVIKVFLPLLIIVILFVVVGQFGFGEISSIRDQISKAQSDQKVLTQKLDILRRIEGSGAQYSNLAVAALPSINPALSVIFQMRILAGTNSVQISDVKTNSPAVDATGLSTVSVSLNVIGARSQVESFVKGIDSFSPISIVDKLKISESAPGTATANIIVKSFWAPFPTKVPAVTQAITDLTPEEQQILQKLSDLTQPVFSEPSAAAGGKSDPFSQ